jgi:hypothetical protein
MKRLIGYVFNVIAWVFFMPPTANSCGKQMSAINGSGTGSGSDGRGYRGYGGDGSGSGNGIGDGDGGGGSGVMQ